MWEIKKRRDVGVCLVPPLWAKYQEKEWWSIPVFFWCILSSTFLFQSLYLHWIVLSDLLRVHYKIVTTTLINPLNHHPSSSYRKSFILNLSLSLQPCSIFFKDWRFPCRRTYKVYYSPWIYEYLFSANSRIILGR